jgi:hypothetical protein
MLSPNHALDFSFQHTLWILSLSSLAVAVTRLRISIMSSASMFTVSQALMAATVDSQLTNFSSPVQPSKLLLTLSSTIVLYFWPHRHPWPTLCSFEDRLCVWKWGFLFYERRGLSFWVGATFVAPSFRTSVPALTQRPRKGIDTLWTPYTLCYFNTLNSFYARCTQDICECRLL